MFMNFLYMGGYSEQVNSWGYRQRLDKRANDNDSLFNFNSPPGTFIDDYLAISLNELPFLHFGSLLV